MSDSQKVTFEDIIKDILLLDNVMLSVRSQGAVAELRLDQNTPFRIKDQYATIGDENGQWILMLTFMNRLWQNLCLNKRKTEEKVIV